MKSILRLSVVVILVALGAVLSAADSAQIQTELVRIDTLTKALDAKGIEAMLATGQPCPLIRSQYSTEKFAARMPELRGLEQAKRDFGLNLARILDQVAMQLQIHADSVGRAKQATLLLDLVGWVKAAKGYGNYMLLSRSESLAAVPLAYLTADLDYPFASVTALRKRMMSPADERAFRVAVLNNEAPKPFIASLTGSDSEQSDQMEIAWNTKWQAISDWFKAKGVTISYWRREALPDELAFFLDDENAPEPLTTVNLWSLKRHNSLIFGYRDGLVKNVDEFMLYREMVGSFPTQPPSWWKPDPTNRWDTSLRAAFQEASKHLRRENGQPFGYDGPALLYLQVSEGNILDHETQLARIAESEKRTQSSKP